MKELEFSIHSPVFEDFKTDINENIQACMKEVYAGNFEGGEISAKISIELGYGYEHYPATDENGEISDKVYQYRKPVMEHKITLTLKKRHETKGKYNAEGMELKADDDRFILAEVAKAQLSFVDMEGRI